MFVVICEDGSGGGYIVGDGSRCRVGEAGCEECLS